MHLMTFSDDHDPVTITYWQHYEPNNYDNKEDKIAIMYDDSHYTTWDWGYNDDNPENLRSFICEALPENGRYCLSSYCLSFTHATHNCNTFTKYHCIFLIGKRTLCKQYANCTSKAESLKKRNVATLDYYLPST